MGNALRNTEYYGLQDTFDNLYERSKSNCTNSINLYNIITSDNNILLAYRNIKSNKGSETEGMDSISIDNYKNMTKNEFLKLIKDNFDNYNPKMVKRVYIPKTNGDKRPLGIPTMLDRIIQQCIKQVIEPICEAKFYSHSYGFRPNRATKDAIARCQSIINRTGLHYVVDIDIKGFFDNICHNKLIKQLYTIGVRDKRVLKIISKMLKSPIKDVGVLHKGTPQGAILSPLLSNVVLNELDQWVFSQWEGFNTKNTYSSQTKKIRALKTSSNLKEMYIVRYADDFKIFTRKRKTAIKIYHAVKSFLKKRLKLDISSEKSKITNLKRNSSEFLGYKLKAIKKRNKFIAKTSISNKNKDRITNEAIKHIKGIQKHPTIQNISKFNSYIISIKNYYKYATNVNIDLAEVQFRISRTLYNRLHKISKYGVPLNPNATYKKYNINKYKTYTFNNLSIHIFNDIRTTNNLNFSQDICNYTAVGREKIKQLQENVETQIAIMQKQIINDNYPMEYLDNKISRYSMQKGKCAILKEFLTVDNVHCHHIVPKSISANHSFENLVIVSKIIHKLIHATKLEYIKEIINSLMLNDKQINKVNIFRRKCNLFDISKCELK